MIKKKTKTSKTKTKKVEEIKETLPIEELPTDQTGEEITQIEEDLAEDIQTTFNEDDFDELGGEVILGEEPEVDDLPDVEEEEE